MAKTAQIRNLSDHRQPDVDGGGDAVGHKSSNAAQRVGSTAQCRCRDFQIRQPDVAWWRTTSCCRRRNLLEKAYTKACNFKMFRVERGASVAVEVTTRAMR